MRRKGKEERRIIGPMSGTDSFCGKVGNCAVLGLYGSFPRFSCSVLNFFSIGGLIVLLSKSHCFSSRVYESSLTGSILMYILMPAINRSGWWTGSARKFNLMANFILR